jgi:hypothetical protein
VDHPPSRGRGLAPPSTLLGRSAARARGKLPRTRPTAEARPRSAPHRAAAPGQPTSRSRPDASVGATAPRNARTARARPSHRAHAVSGYPSSGSTDRGSSAGCAGMSASQKAQARGAGAGPRCEVGTGWSCTGHPRRKDATIRSPGNATSARSLAVRAAIGRRRRPWLQGAVPLTTTPRRTVLRCS